MKQLRNFMYAFLFLATMMVLFSCNNDYQQKQAQVLAELRSQISVNVSGAKSIGGGGSSENSRSRSGDAVSRSSASDVMSLVKFYSDGKSDSIFTSLPEYSNMEYCSVGSIVVSPDGSVYIVWAQNTSAPSFSNVPFVDKMSIDYSAGTNASPAVMLQTGQVWRITKDGELTWFNQYEWGTMYGQEPILSFPWGTNRAWNGNSYEYLYLIDKYGNLYAFESNYSSSSNPKILQYNPNTQTVKTVSLCATNSASFKIFGDYIIEYGEYGDYTRVVPINDPDGYWYLSRNGNGSDIWFYDSINDVGFGSPSLYSPFKPTNIVAFEKAEVSTVKPFFRGKKLYALVSDSKIYAMNYSNHEYTLDESSVIDVTEISSKLFSNGNIPEKNMNSLGYFYLDSDTVDFFPHIMFVDGTTGTIRDLNTNLPSNIDIYDIAVNETDVYFTGARGTTPISGKINIATGAYTNSGTSVPIKVLATVDF